ncbi:7873_t:CDS:1, partial [Gigaspora rosea]
MTVEMEKEPIVPNMSENLTKNEITKAKETLINNWAIFVQNISEEDQTI